MDSGSIPPMGRQNRTEHRRADRRRAGQQAASRTRLPDLPWHPALLSGRRSGSCRGGLGPGPRTGRAQLQERRIPPCPEARQGSVQRQPPGDAFRPRQSARSRLLPLKLAACDWIAERRNLLVTGAAGLGKSWLACALGHKACRENMSVLYTRIPRLFADWAIAHGDPRYARLLRSIARVKLLILDDWGPEALTPEQARDLLEIVEDRYDKGSLIITSQVPVDRWHDLIGIPTLADAILDRVIHNAYRIDLAGESLRKRLSSS